MKTLIVTQYFWPEEIRINDLAIGLRERGHEVTVFTGKPNYPQGRFLAGYGFFTPAREDYRGVCVARVPLLPRGAGSGARLIVNHLSFAVVGSLLAPFRDTAACDVILVYESSPVTVGLLAIVMKWVRRAPILFWVQHLWPENLSATGAVRSRSVLRFVDWLVRFIYRRCDLILVQSRAFISHVREKGVAEDRLRYYPNSATDPYRPVILEAQAAKRMLMPDGFRVMFASNIGAAQDFETIFGAAEHTQARRDIHWITLGDGRLRTWGEREVERRDLQETVYLLGRHPLESMPRFSALADAMLVTLRNEPVFALTIPSKIQLYLACARSIIAALEGEGARVIEESGEGIVVKSGNAAALTEAAMKIYRASVTERSTMGQRGLEYFKQYFERTLLLSRIEGWGRSLVAEAKCAF